MSISCTGLILRANIHGQHFCNHKVKITYCVTIPLWFNHLLMTEAGQQWHNQK